MNQWKESVERTLANEFGVSMEEATVIQLYQGISKTASRYIKEPSREETLRKKQVCYFSAEFLVGRMIYNNLLNLGLYKEYEELMKEHGLDVTMFEEIEDAALGNGGLGRLAACFLDSGATIGICLNGYGIRYKYGLFKQALEEGAQKELLDDWQKYTDPWGIRKEEEKVIVSFQKQSVYAIPYDYQVVGYQNGVVNRLRLWQAEPMEVLDFEAFNEQKYTKAFKAQNEAMAISALLYPNDSTKEGKRLRLKQQYFFVSASLQDMVRSYRMSHNDGFDTFSQRYAIQLNDTHPVVAIPELLRILVEEQKVLWSKAVDIVRGVCAYTNHTVMAEALETWSVALFRSVLPSVYRILVKLNRQLVKELRLEGLSKEEIKQYEIISDGTIHMVRLAVYGSHSINGVAQIHTEILKKTILKKWYERYPNRFQNKTNGITQRRWLALCNKELSQFITNYIGEEWILHLEELKKLKTYASDFGVIEKFNEIKERKKTQLAEYIKKKEGISLLSNAIFDVQVKRIHEYKRQLLHALSILDIYFGIKEGRIKDFYPTVFLFGGKAAPGYQRAKGVIKFINEIACLIQKDPQVNQYMQVVFVSNYNVSYAEKIVPAADVSEQISTAGTEASGTGNMKFMLNGAVTLGTYDGANIEIVQQAGMENNYIFGVRVEEIEELSDDYCPQEYYKKNKRLKRVLDTLVDGTFQDGNTGIFEELYTSLLEGASWHRPDPYYLCLDFDSYVETKLKVNGDYKKDRLKFRKKCFHNVTSAGIFSSDRTIYEYANDIWGYDSIS